MPHLDSSALTTDVNGLEFLKAVIETAPEAAGSRRPFDMPLTSGGWTVQPGIELPRAASEEFVSELA